MSGTSLDGLDLACCEFWLDDELNWRFAIRDAETLPYTAEWQERLGSAISLSPPNHQKLEEEYSSFLGKTLKNFLGKTQFVPELIGSHGHTTHHRPEQGVSVQIGDGGVITQYVQIPVVSNFRLGDVQLGGQGAPLVPIGDELLFGQYTACLNLGGIANISFKKNGQRIAFDIGLANMGLNDLMKNESPAYDDGGRKAQIGSVQPLLLEQLNALPYYDRSPPKSTGIEWYLAEVKPLLDGANCSKEDKLRTLIEHMTSQIISVLPHINSGEDCTLLVTGGGAHNRFWMKKLQDTLPSNYQLNIPSRQWIDYKEALVFAFMALLKQQNQINILSSVTGASRDSIGGILFDPAS